MNKRTCAHCGGENYSADTSQLWRCCWCRRYIFPEHELVTVDSLKEARHEDARHRICSNDERGFAFAVDQDTLPDGYLPNEDIEIVPLDKGDNGRVRVVWFETVEAIEMWIATYCPAEVRTELL